MPSVTDQVATFLNSTRPVPSRSVVVIFIGVNDIFYGGLNVDVNALTTSVLNNVKLLVARGTTPSSPTSTRSNFFSQTLRLQLIRSLNPSCERFPPRQRQRRRSHRRRLQSIRQKLERQPHPINLLVSPPAKRFSQAMGLVQFGRACTQGRGEARHRGRHAVSRMDSRADGV